MPQTGPTGPSYVFVGNPDVTNREILEILDRGTERIVIATTPQTLIHRTDGIVYPYLSGAVLVKFFEPHMLRYLRERLGDEPFRTAVGHLADSPGDIRTRYCTSLDHAHSLLGWDGRSPNDGNH